MSTRSTGRHDRSMGVRLGVAEARGRLHAVALPCLVWGLATVVVVGGFHLYYLPGAHGMDLLAVAVTGKVVVGALLWLLPHAAALWWLRCGGAAPFVAFLALAAGAAIGFAVLFWQVTRSPLGALVGLVVGGWVPAVELHHAASVRKLEGSGRVRADERVGRIPRNQRRRR